MVEWAREIRLFIRSPINLGAINEVVLQLSFIDV